MSEQGKRALKAFATLAGLIIIVMAIPVIHLITGINIPCPLNALTGLRCPGCGATRMMKALLQLDFGGAFGYNPVVLLSAPILAVIVFRICYRYIRYGIKEPEKWVWVTICATAAVYILFGVVRNFIGI